MSKKYANVIVDISHSNLNRVFQYAVPEKLMETIKIGMMVNIPFGNANREVRGYVIGLETHSDLEVSKIKSIIDCSDKLTIETQLINLAVWMQKYYACTIQSALKCMLPSKREIISRQDPIIEVMVSKAELVKAIQGWRKRHYPALTRAGEYLLTHNTMKKSQLCKEAKIPTTVVKNLERKQMIKLVRQGEMKSPPLNSTNGHVTLNPSQQHAVNTVIKSYQTQHSDVFLLHGVTGSGKTEVYIRIIEHVIQLGKQAIVLVPEISLTPQTVRRFKERFGSLVGVMHSRLSKGERYDVWMKAKENKIAIMVGARSAIFTPFSRLGLIVMDEEHEMTYKSETTPKYHAREVAIRRAELNGAKVLLGSATPSLESFYKAKNDQYTLLELKHKAAAKDNLKVEIVDMRDELAKGNKSIFSRRLYELIKNRLCKNEQILLFLNRRGHSNFVSCRQCGYVFKCKHCDISYTYHSSKHQLVCHYCGDTMPLPSVCPACGSKYLKPFGIGTQKVEACVKELFPKARVLRMDMDTTTKKDSFSRIIHQFSNYEADILIGTQMIAKGHDFDRVTLVGVLAADQSLHNHDFRASERTFQLITQVAGRAGRGRLPGVGVIQTYTPDHYSIIRASKEDYASFYEEELAFRKLMHYPPFSHFMVLLMQSSDEKHLIHHVYDLAGIIRKMLDNSYEIIGPSPANISKVKDYYRQRLMITHRDYDALLKFIKAFYKFLERDKSYQSIAIQFDINPLVSY